MTVACSGGAETSAGGQSAPEVNGAPPAATSSAPTRLNMDELFPPGEGRDLVLNNCQSCHNFAPILTLQMDAQQWDRNRNDHRERVSQVSDADVQKMYDYLKKTFNPDRPVPTLPKEMLDSWTSY
jgi:hypothetical protein